MYKLLIAEDEEIFRKVLPIIIDWNSIGFDIVGIVENGFEALKFMENMEVDIIMTDIRMPILNGLELAMEVKSRYPRTKTVLLSAFNEFEYARKGIDCGVYGYLLKSDDEENIAKYFIKLAKTLAQENQVYKTDESLWCYREAFLRNLINNNGFDKNTVLEQIKMDFSEIPEDKFLLSVIRLDEYNRIIQIYGAGKIRNIIKSIRTFLVKNIELKKLGYIIEIDDMLCIIWNQPEELCHKSLKIIHEEITKEISIIEMLERNELTLTIASSGSIEGFYCIGKVYVDVLNAFKHRTYLGGNKILYSTQLKDQEDYVMTFSEEVKIIREIQGLINDGDSCKVIQYLDGLEESLIKVQFSDIDQIITISVKIILAVSNDVGRMRGNTEQFLTKSSYLIKEIGFCETISTIFRKLGEFLAEVIALLHKENTPVNKRITEEAVKYIQENYSKNISLESVAKHVNVHPVHLSRLFSKDIGKTFKNVLTDFRMEEAKKMLIDINNKVYEVAFAVGYENPRYFSELFRSITNLTPVEYREKFKS